MKKLTLTMIVLALAVCLTVLLASCSCGSETPAETSVAESSSFADSADTTPVIPAGTTPAVTTTAEAVMTTTEPSVSTSKRPAVTYVPVTEKVAVDGKISLTASDVKIGLLLMIDGDHPYDTTVNPLFMGDYTTTVDDAKKAGFSHISTAFFAVDNNHFLRTEVLEATVAMIAHFDAVAGTNKPFRVEGYKLGLVTRYDAGFTGNVVNIRTMYDGNTYGLDYVNHRLMYNGEMVTYDKWFEAHAVQYGFVYEGLAGSDNTHSGQFRYVGTVHAAGIQAAGSLEDYVAAIKDGTMTSVTLGEETWKLTYVKILQDDGGEAVTEFEVGENATFIVSGDNREGVIVAVKQAIVE